MIVAILAIYGAFLALLEKLGVIRWNRFWIMSIPALWAALQVALLIPMGWTSPQGPAIVLRNTVQITPDVTGEVIDIPVVPNTPLKAGDVLFQIDPKPFEAAVAALEAQLSVREEQLAADEALLERDVRSRLTVLEERSVVEGLRVQLDQARWNLENSTVRAPADGFVTNVALRVGSRAGGAPVMAFIDTSTTGVAVEITQANARYIVPGQTVEIAFKFAPGEIHTGKVRTLVQAISTGQVAPTGLAATPAKIVAAPFIAVVDLDDAEFARTLPMGATGTAAIYTDRGAISRPIRKIILRQMSIMNYVLPF
jgi:multidrug resistance efflux pump